MLASDIFNIHNGMLDDVCINNYFGKLRKCCFMAYIEVLSFGRKLAGSDQ